MTAMGFLWQDWCIPHLGHCLPWALVPWSRVLVVSPSHYVGAGWMEAAPWVHGERSEPRDGAVQFGASWLVKLQLCFCFVLQ